MAYNIGFQYFHKTSEERCETLILNSISKWFSCQVAQESKQIYAICCHRINHVCDIVTGAKI